jgi:adenine-specific DNA methylase
MQSLSRKRTGAYFTPDDVAQTLVQWAVRRETDRLLDPSCGDGQFIVRHQRSVGIEINPHSASQTAERAPWALVHPADFFAWVAETQERFECAAGNPPFIRYQSFNGEMRRRALEYCAVHGAAFTGLTSSWAPFLVAASTVLRPGGRMAFVVPAEIGHAPYATPLLEYFATKFSVVHIVATRDKLFPDLSEDCWLLYAEGYGGQCDVFRFTPLERFEPTNRPPQRYAAVSIKEWRSKWNCKLRPFLLPRVVRDTYSHVVAERHTARLGQLARIGIGYVSGANDFFHLRPSQAKRLDIPRALLHPTVRNGRALPTGRLCKDAVNEWIRADDPVLLLRLHDACDLPSSVRAYLDSADGRQARTGYKCRTRTPWYVVPDVQVPEFFLSYMSGLEPTLSRNLAGCTGTNSVHVIRTTTATAANRIESVWGDDLVQLSCEIEGHPLGGGMLKLEVREAARVVIPPRSRLPDIDADIIRDGVALMRQWRHYADA